MQQQQKQKSILFLIFMVSIRKFPIIFCSQCLQKKSKISGGRIWDFEKYENSQKTKNERMKQKQKVKTKSKNKE